MPKTHFNKVRIHLTLPPDIYEKLQKEAKKTYTSVSHILNTLAIDYLNRNKSK